MNTKLLPIVEDDRKLCVRRQQLIVKYANCYSSNAWLGEGIFSPSMLDEEFGENQLGEANTEAVLIQATTKKVQ